MQRETTLRRAGVPEEIAIRITGHRSRADFARYNIDAEAGWNRASYDAIMGNVGQTAQAAEPDGDGSQNL